MSALFVVGASPFFAVGAATARSGSDHGVTVRAGGSGTLWIAHAHTFLKRGALEAVPGDGISSNWLDAELTHCQAHGLKLQYEIEFTIEQCCGHIMKRERPLFNSKCEHLSCYILRLDFASTLSVIDTFLKFYYSTCCSGHARYCW